jgi:hypothetical protein
MDHFSEDTDTDVSEDKQSLDIANLRAQIEAKVNACCPFTVRFHRTISTDKDRKWNEKCVARAIGLRWKGQAPVLYCEWPIGSGQVHSAGTIGFEFLKIYAQITGVYAGEVRRPNGWKEIKACVERLDLGDEEVMIDCFSGCYYIIDYFASRSKKSTSQCLACFRIPFAKE